MKHKAFAVALVATIIAQEFVIHDRLPEPVYLQTFERVQLRKFENYFADYAYAQAQLASVGPILSAFGRFVSHNRAYTLAITKGSPMILIPCPACSIAIDDAPQWKFELGMRNI